MLLFKVFVAPLLICVATLIGRRWGPVVGGWIAGLPLTSGPVSILFALQFGPTFAREAAEATLLGVVTVVIFAAIYARLALHSNPAASLVAALLGYAVSAAAVSQMHFPLWAAATSTLVVVAVGLRVIGPSPAPVAATPPPRWDLPFRAAVAALMVLSLTALGKEFGAQVAGVLSPFPVFACTMAVFSHIVGGSGSAHRLLRGVAAGSFAFATFFIIVALVVTRTTLWAAYLAAAIMALAVNGVSLKFIVLRSAG